MSILVDEGRQINPGTDHSYSGLVTLLELLRFHAERFSRVTRIMDDLKIGLAYYAKLPRWWWSAPFSMIVGIGRNERELHKNLFVEVRKQLEAMKELLSDCDMPVSIRQISDLLDGLDSGKKSDLRDVDELQHTIDREFSARVFFTIPYSRRELFSEPSKGWEEIIRRFPTSQDDIEEMNKCFALSRYTAAVFHSLLVVEHGLIELGQYLKVSDPKPGWDATSNKLKAVVHGGHKSLPAGLDFNFIEQANSRVESMKMAWRNKVGHAAGKLVIEKSGFTDFAAEEIILACRSFMRHIADGLPP